MNKAARLAHVIGKKSRRIIGLMSGMSMDGIDLAHAEISGDFPKLKVKILGSGFRQYSNEFRRRLISGQTAQVAEVSRLNVIIAAEFAQTVRDYLHENKVDHRSVDAIGSHGQTLFHSTCTEESVPSTLQIGAPSLIAELTGIMTIGNFRVRDIAAGGHGAPMVSLADYILFHDQGCVALNNLGSISNVTVVTPDVANMLAFDTGPANMAIDFFARNMAGNIKGIDDSGNISAQGTCIPELLQALLENPFFRRPPPKAAGYSEFGPARLEEIARKFAPARSEDLVRTAVEWSARTIANAYENFILPKFPDLKKATFSGGGIYNLTLMRRIGDLLPAIAVETLHNDLSDSKEALAFAILANETLSGRAGSFPSITGASRPTVLGEISL